MRIFISYNSVDREWAEWIAGVLREAGYNPRLQAWHFRPSENFVLRMQQETENADATIAVLSEDYFKSTFTGPEWAAAFVQDPQGKKHRLIPIRVHECQPLGLFKATIYVDLIGLDETQARARVLDAFRESGVPDYPPKFPGQPASARHVQAAPFPAGLGRLYGNPPSLPAHYLERQQYLTDLRQKLISLDGGRVGVEGMGGVGKTVLAAELARDAQVRAAFPDGIYWLTVGQQTNIHSLQAELAKWCGADMTAIAGGANAKDELSRTLAGRRVLVVLDDVWQFDDMATLDVVSKSGRLLITTRNREVLVSVGAVEHKIKVLTPEESLRLLALWAGADIASTLPLEATEVAKECGFLPLALAMIGAMIRLRPSALGDALEQLRHRDLEEFRRLFPDYPYPNLMRAIAVGVDALEAVDRDRYLDLAVFLEGEAVPQGALQVLWGLNASKTRRFVDRLVAHSLMTVKQRTDGVMLVSLHDLQNDYVCKHREQELPQLHERLLANYAAKCRASDTGGGAELDAPDRRTDRLVPQNIVGHERTTIPWHLGPNDGYFFQRLLRHMVQAGCQEELVDLLRDYRWLQAKLEATDVSAVLEDYQELSRPYEKIGLIGEAIRLSAPAVSADGMQLASQLLGRLLESESPEIFDLLEQCRQRKSTAWLHPLRRSLTQPGSVLRFVLRGHTDRVNAVAVTPDGERAVSASRDGTIRVWDLKHGTQSAVFSQRTDEYIAIAITPDGKRVVAAESRGHSSDGIPNGVPGPRHSRRVFIWYLDYPTRPPGVKDFGDTHWASVDALALSPDGRLVFTVVSSGLRVEGCYWDLETRMNLFETKLPEEIVSAVSFIADERHVCCVGEQSITVWDLLSQKIVRTLAQKLFSVDSNLSYNEYRKQADWVYAQKRNLACVTSRDGRFVITGCADYNVKVWDLRTEEPPHCFNGHTDKVLSVALDWDEHRVVSGSADKTVRVWELETGVEQSRLTGHNGPVTMVAITRDGKTIVSASADSTLRVWNLERTKKERVLPPHTASVNCVGVTANGKKAISCTGNVVNIWDVETGHLLDSIERSEGESVSAAGIGPDGKRVFIVLQDSVVIYDLQQGQEVKELPYEPMLGPVSADLYYERPGWKVGNLVPLTSDEGIFVLQTAYPYVDWQGPIISAMLSGFPNPKDYRLILRVWDVEHSNVRLERVIHTHRGCVAAMTPDGRIAISDDRVTGTTPDTDQRWHILVWDLEDGKEPFWERGKRWMVEKRGWQTLYPHITQECEGEILSISEFGGRITTLAVSSDGRRAVSGSEDLILRIWDLENGHVIASFFGDSVFTASAISSEGTTVVIAGDLSGQVHLLRLEEPSYTEEAC